MFVSKLVLMHDPSQRVVPPVQLHSPAVQVPSAPQVMPQPPQLLVSVSVFTHVPSHSVVAAGQPPPVHIPLVQT